MLAPLSQAWAKFFVASMASPHLGNISFTANHRFRINELMIRIVPEAITIFEVIF